MKRGGKRVRKFSAARWPLVFLLGISLLSCRGREVLGQGLIEEILDLGPVQRLRVRLDVLYVHDPARTTSPAQRIAEGESASRAVGTRAWVRRHLEQGVRTLSAQGVNAAAKVRRGRALEEILSEAADGGYDLIVIGGHLRRTWFKIPEQDLASYLITRANRPVLVVKPSFDR